MFTQAAAFAMLPRTSDRLVSGIATLVLIVVGLVLILIVAGLMWQVYRAMLLQKVQFAVTDNATALQREGAALDRERNELQREANKLMRELIEALRSTPITVQENPPQSLP